MRQQSVLKYGRNNMTQYTNNLIWSIVGSICFYGLLLCLIGFSFYVNVFFGIVIMLLCGWVLSIIKKATS